jgi:hypothetical protein
MLSFIEPYAIAGVLKDIAHPNKPDDWPKVFGHYLAETDKRARLVLVVLGIAIVVGACLMRKSHRSDSA